MGSNKFVLENFSNEPPDIVVLFSAWSNYPQFSGRVSDFVEGSATKLLAMGVKRIIIMGPAPRWDGNLPEILYTHWRQAGKPEVAKRLTSHLRKDTFDVDAKMGAREWPENVDYVSVISSFCNVDGCMTLANEDTFDLTTWDYGHLTTPGARHIASYVLQSLASGH